MISLSCSLERAGRFFYVSIRDKTFGKIFRKSSFSVDDSLSTAERIFAFLTQNL